MQGDNDPVDVVEIGSVQCQQGGVYKVKPLGAYAMIDDGELDWKIVCIRTDDPMADVLNDIEDVERCVNSATCTLQRHKMTGLALMCGFAVDELWLQTMLHRLSEATCIGQNKLA